jgi:hypothetical protein
MVYFGTSRPGILCSSQFGATFSVGPLEARTTYYWRIDEVNDKGLTTGPVWSFTTEGIPADRDRDGDVDQEDFGRFQTCLSDWAETTISPECLWADLDADTLVGQADCVLFLECVSGPNTPVTCLP